MRNGTLPVSLLFRANLFKDGFKLPWRAKLPGFSERPRDKLPPIVNLNWSADPLRFYAEKQAFTWPTCTQAFTAKSTFFLMWARIHRCSCIYDMQHTFLKLSPIDKKMLTWLKKKVRPKLRATAEFHGKVDTPIKRNENGFVNWNCLWNEFISGILPTEDDEDDIDKYVRWYNMTKAAEFGRSNIPVEIREILKNRCRYLSSADSSDEEEATSPSNLKASSPSHQDDSKWDIGQNFFLQYKIVTETAEQGICLAKTPTYSSLNARIAMTIMGYLALIAMGK